MAVEARRACGYRKVGGMYMVSKGLGSPCCRMPIKLCVCPTCGAGMKQSRSYEWIDPKPWLEQACQSNSICPASDASKMGDKVLLMWVGTKYYPTADIFMEEAHRLGVSKRIAMIPRGFELGKSWVFLAHPKVIQSDDGSWSPGVFQIFQPDAIEKIVTQSQTFDAELMDSIRRRNMTPVVVPDSDLDHLTDSPKAATLQTRSSHLDLLH